MSWLLLIVAVVAAIAGLYGLYTLYVILRLLIAARRLRRECASRDLKVECKLSAMLFDDLEDPFYLKAIVRKDERRQFSFIICQSLLDLAYTAVTVEPLALSKRLRGRVSVEPRAKTSRTSSIHVGGDFELHTFGIDEMDARYRLSEGKSESNAPDAIALVRTTLSHGAVQKELAAYNGSLVFERGHLSIRPGADGGSFVDGIARVVTLADALDEAVKSENPYR